MSLTLGKQGFFFVILQMQILIIFSLTKQKQSQGIGTQASPDAQNTSAVSQL